MLSKKESDDVLPIIEHNEGITYEELVHISLWSPESIEKTLRKLKKDKVIESIVLKGRKAKGLRLTR